MAVFLTIYDDSAYFWDITITERLFSPLNGTSNAYQTG